LSVYTKPDLFSRIEASPAYHDGIVVLFLDELLQADHLTQKVLTDLILNGRIGEFVLPNNVWIIAASNFQEDGAGVNRALTILTNRLIVIDVHLPLSAWKKYAARTGLPEIGIEFACFREDIIFSQAIPARSGPFPTPRSFTDALRFVRSRQASMNISDPMDVPADEMTRAGVAGSIGEAAMIEFYAYAAEYKELPKFEEIILDPLAAKLPDQTKPASQYAACQLLVRNATADCIEQVWKYAERLVLDLQARLANELLEKSYGGVLFNSPNFARWMAQHKTLLVNSCM